MHEESYFGVHICSRMYKYVQSSTHMFDNAHIYTIEYIYVRVSIHTGNRENKHGES